jgi:hypothetical protein
MPKDQNGNTKHWPVVSARIEPELRDKLSLKHPNSGDVSKVIRALLDKYINNRIFGLDISKY